MTVAEITAHPVDAVQRLYQQAGCPTESDEDWGVGKHFQEAVAALGTGEVPHLTQVTAERLPHHSLVRFHGMVQDLLNPEYYVGAFQQPNGQWTTTKFCDPDIPDEAHDGGSPVVWERRPIVCVPVPGLSSWALPAANSNPASPHAANTNQESQLADTPQPQAQQQQQQQQQPARPKRERSSDADTQHDSLGAELRAASNGGGAAAAGASPPPPLRASPHHPQGCEDSISRDTGLSDDQGDGGAAAAAAGSGSPGETEGTIRPRTRRREDPGAGADAAAPAVASAATEVAPAAGAASGCDTAAMGEGGCEACGGGEGCTHGDTMGPGSSGGTAAAAGAAERQACIGEVPGSCMVYLYDTAPALVLHEVVEFVGILSHVPELAALEYDNQEAPLEQELASLGLDGGNRAAAPAGGAALTAQQQQQGDRLAFEALRAAHPPTSKVMRLHAIIVRRAPQLVPPTAAPVSAAPITAPAPAAGPAAAIAPAVTAAPASAVQAAASAASVAPLRDRALGLLRWTLGGDSVAAEYVLLSLLSRVASRGDPAALGQLALNLSRCPGAVTSGSTASGAAATTPSASSAAAAAASHSSPALAVDRLGGRGPSAFASALHAAVSRLVPLSAALPLTVEGCNNVSWSPARDVARERTAPSPLQLAPGTVLLLDETVMAPGQLNSQGVVSMQALMALAQKQQLLYDFEAFTHPIPVDLPLIVLTQGRSLLRESLPVRLPLTATQPFPSVDAILAATSSSTSATFPAHPGAAASADGADGDGEGMSMDAAPGAADSSTAAVGLAAVRSYLAAARAADGYELAEGMAAVLEQYFVGQRRAGQHGGQQQGAAAGAGGGGGGGESMTAEEFHLKLSLARLLVLSHGETRLTQERWQQLLQLEHTREARLRVVG